MLYLNIETTTNKQDTSAIFNFNKCCIWILINTALIRVEPNSNLTLTNVVFELFFIVPSKLKALFNFNKCCIWIHSLAIV